MRKALHVIASLWLALWPVLAQDIMVVRRGQATGGGGGFAEVGAGSQRVASGANSDVDSDTTAYPGNVTSGTLLIVAGTWWGSTAAPTGITVSGCGASWTTTLGAVPAFTWRTFISYGTGHTAGACTVTVNPSGADSVHDGSYSMDEFSGQHSTPLDVDGGNSTGFSTTPSDGITTVAANALIIGVMSHDRSTMALTPGASYTQVGETESNSFNQCHNAEFRIVTTAQLYTVDWTTGSSTDWSAQTMSFKPQ